MASLQIETERLRALGLILREKRGGRVFYRPELEHSAWQPIRELIRTTADPVEVLEDALAQVPGIQAAFVFGSFARGEAVEESDVDVLVLGEEIPSAQIGWAGLESSILLGRSVNICRLTREEIEARLALGSVFVKSILESPKRWIIGNEEVLPQAA
ncbi:MAG TPA: nucleotidyltransferase domain-containing protein [Gemmatimonadota bacterium]|nr:nucleotidyltransferase domain-containing protein [Gemmatimonadota bacterium]